MKVLAFAPFSAVWIHAFPEALILEALRQEGHEIVYVTCGRALQDFCTAMNATGLSYDASPEQKAAVCDQCCRNARVLRREFGFQGYDLAEFIDEGIFADIEATLAGVTAHNFQDFSLAGLGVGRAALYQFLILRKKSSIALTPEEWQEYRSHLKMAAVAAVALERIFERVRPERVVLYNGLYSVNALCRELAAQSGAFTYAMHAGGGLSNRLQTIMLGREHPFRYMFSLLRYWKKSARDRPLPLARMKSVTGHFIELFSARSAFVYSAPKQAAAFDLRKRFGVVAGQQVLVATMSSYDEEFAAESVGARVYDKAPLFASQVEWLHALVGYFAERSHLFLVIRVHPREAPNRREGARSEQMEKLEAVLSHLPPNVKVNWPQDQISVYDLAEETSVFLNSWSSVGKEMSLLGLPVVTYAPEVLFYPADLNYSASSLAEYFAAIESALEDGWQAERIRQTYRWLGVEYGSSLLDISESYHTRETEVIPLPRRVVNRLRRALDPDAPHVQDCERRAPHLKQRAVINRLVQSGADTLLDLDGALVEEHSSLLEESRNLRDEMRRLLRALYKTGIQEDSSAGKPGTLRARLTAFAAG